MIQRIQTLFLFIACGLLFSLFFVPMATNAAQPTNYTDSSVLLALLIILILISFLSIFLYRHRMLQIRLCILNSLLLLGFQGIIAYYFFTASEGTVFSLTAVFPIVSAILTFTAMRYIARDEAMVRAADRLRK